MLIDSGTKVASVTGPVQKMSDKQIVSGSGRGAYCNEASDDIVPGVTGALVLQQLLFAYSASTRSNSELRTALVA